METAAAAGSTAAGLAAAKQVFRGRDWDSEGTVSAHLPADVAVKFLHAHGWTLRSGRWVSPDNSVACWEMGEAFTLAIAASALS